MRSRERGREEAIERSCPPAIKLSSPTSTSRRDSGGPRWSRARVPPSCAVRDDNLIAISVKKWFYADEVSGLTEESAKKLGTVIVSPSSSRYLCVFAASRTPPRLSNRGEFASQRLGSNCSTFDDRLHSSGSSGVTVMSTVVPSLCLASRCAFPLRRPSISVFISYLLSGILSRM